jgi:hypothetical protein
MQFTGSLYVLVFRFYFAALPKTYKPLGAASFRRRIGKPSGFRFSSGIDPDEDNGSIGFLGISNGTCLCRILDPLSSAGSEYRNSPKGPASTEHSVKPGQFQASEPGSEAFPKLPIHSNIRYIEN